MTTGTPRPEQVNAQVSGILLNRRIELGYSWRKLGELTDMNFMTAMRAITGQRPMTIEELHAFSRALGLVSWEVLREAETTAIAPTNATP